MSEKYGRTELIRPVVFVFISELGQTRKSGDAILTSVLPSRADIRQRGGHVRKVPTTDIQLRLGCPILHSLPNRPSVSLIETPVSAQTKAEWPNLFEAKTIAEEGFIYGLPIVMNYAVMYEYSVDKNSGQYKAPFNQIHNEARVFTYKDTAVITPNSDTPYSILWLDLRAEPIVLSVPAVDKSRYYSVMLCDGNTFNYGYVGSRATGSEAGDYMVVGPDWKGATPPGIKKVFQSSTQFSAVAYRTLQGSSADAQD